MNTSTVRYYGRHYEGQFRPLDTAFWSHGADEEDAIVRAALEEDKARSARLAKMGPQARLCYAVFHALSDQYCDNPTGNPKDLRALRFWARSLEDCERRGL